MSPVYANDTDVSVYLNLKDSVTGQPKTGYTISNLKLQYTRNRSAPSTATALTALAATTTAHTDNRGIEIDGTDSKGLYRIDVPDAAFADGVDKVIIVVSGSGVDPAMEEIPLRFPPGILRSGITQGGGSLTTAILDTGASATDEAYRDAVFEITTGANAGKCRQIKEYTGSSKTATFFPDDQLNAAPNTVGYRIHASWQARMQHAHALPAIPLSGTQAAALKNAADMIVVGGYPYVDLQKIGGNATALANLLVAMLTELTGEASGGGHSTTVMNTNLSETVTGKFIGRRVYWTSGVLNRESATITAYNGGTKQLGYAATTAAPSDGDTFIIV